jgi:hypothetical protein
VESNQEAMKNFCHSCGAPLDLPEFKSKNVYYCRFCADDHGRLRSLEVVVEGCAEWFLTWMPDLNKEKALIRAAKYVRAMPAWAED